MPEYDARVGRSATQLRGHALKHSLPVQRTEVQGGTLPRCEEQSADGRLVCYLDRGHKGEVCQFRLRELAEQLHSQPRYIYAPVTTTNGNGKPHE